MHLEGMSEIQATRMYSRCGYVVEKIGSNDN